MQLPPPRKCPRVFASSPWAPPLAPYARRRERAFLFRGNLPDSATARVDNLSRLGTRPLKFLNGDRNTVICDSDNKLGDAQMPRSWFRMGNRRLLAEAGELVSRATYADRTFAA